MSGHVSDIKRVINKRAQEVVDLMLYVGEYPLKPGGIQGSASFQNAFKRNAKKDKQGRSLKDFNLESHLFEHRCSYMIHSSTFKSLPKILRHAIYIKLDEILSGRDTSKNYQHLSTSEREIIRQILVETEPEARMIWHNNTFRHSNSNSSS